MYKTFSRGAVVVVVVVVVVVNATMMADGPQQTKSLRKARK